jgi:enoyl-CoA hydratase/carnithine racemase
MIRLDKDGDLWTLTLDRPDKANALTPDMLSEIADIAEGAQVAKCLIITGAGRVFSAGADLDAARAGLAGSPIWERVSGAIAALPCLTITALNGSLAGGAFGMALACDLRISVPTAKFFYPVMKLGFLPQPSDPPRMNALMGPARTKMILMAGQKIDAPTALDWGLVDQISAPDVLITTAKTLAADVLKADATQIAGIKGLI